MGACPVAVLASGSGSNLQAILDRVEAGDVDATVDVVVSDNRHAKALDRAVDHGAEAVFVDPDGKDRAQHDAEVGDAIGDAGADLVVLAGYLRILGPAFVDRFRERIVNIHPALLPLFGGEGFYGLRVHEAAIQAGVRFSGATTHFVTEDVDQGPIILQAAVPVRPDDTPRSLQRRVIEVEHRILPRTVDLYANDRLAIDDSRVDIRPGDSWTGDQPDVLYAEGY